MAQAGIKDVVDELFLESVEIIVVVHGEGGVDLRRGTELWSVGLAQRAPLAERERDDDARAGEPHPAKNKTTIEGRKLVDGTTSTPENAS